MDTQELIQNVVQILTFFLPYLLLKGGKIAAQKALEEAGKKFTDSAWEQAEKVFGEIKKHDPSAQPALEKAAEKTDEKQRAERIEAQIKFSLEDFPQLVKELQPLVNISANGGSVAANEIKDSVIAIHNEKHETNVYLNGKTDPASFDLFKNKYLAWMSLQCGRVQLSAILQTLEEDERKEKITLEDIYVGLDASLSTPKERQPQGEKFNEKAESRIPLVEALENESLRRVVVKGDAGSGKSTFVNYMVVSLAARALGEEVKKPLPESSKLKDYFPVRVILRDTAAQMAADENLKGVDILWNTLRQDLKNLGADEVENHFSRFKTYIENTPCLIMLDGLDEVSLSEQRKRHLVTAIETFAKLLPKSIVMVTARPYAYEKSSAWNLGGFEVLALLELDDEKIASFINDFYDIVQIARGLQEDDMEERKTRILREIGDKKYLRELAGRPLLLTLIAAVDRTRAKLPESRAELYEQAVDLLLVRWHEGKKSGVEESKIVNFFSEQRADVLAILWKLAYRVHQRQYQLKDMAGNSILADISRDEVCGAFSGVMSKLGVDDVALMSFLENRAGLLIGKGEEVYRFPHRSFQEYLAARYVISREISAYGSEEKEKVTLRNVVLQDLKWWREVGLLGISSLKASQSLGAVAGKAHEFISRSYVETLKIRKIEDKDWQVALFVGLAMAETRLAESVDDANQAIIERVKGWLEELVFQVKLSPAERADAADVLDGLGYTPADLYSFVEITNLQSPVSTYYLSKYPVTNAQYERFLTPENFQNKSLWRDFEKFNEKSGTMNETWGEEAWNWLQTELQDKDNDVKDGVLYPRYWHDPRFGKSRKYAPVVGISWYEASAYCKWLTEQMQNEELRMQIFNLQSQEDSSSFILHNSSLLFRLPTDKEWTDAAGGDEDDRFAFGGKELKDKITEYANTRESGINRTTPVWMYPKGVGEKYDLMDMSGNVFEWQANYKDIKNGYLGLRGGSWYPNEGNARVSIRYDGLPSNRLNYIGFRVVACSLPSGIS